MDLNISRQKINLKYKPFYPEKINHTFLVMTNQGYINSETIEKDCYCKAMQERIVIEKDLLNKMSSDAVDIIKIMLIAPREFLFIISQITNLSKRGYFNKTKNSNRRTIKLRFRIWLMRFLKEKHKCSYLDADIRAGKIMREIKDLIC